MKLAQVGTQDFGGCDSLVENAGTHTKTQGGRFPIEEVIDADWERVRRVNVAVPFVRHDPGLSRAESVAPIASTSPARGQRRNPERSAG